MRRIRIVQLICGMAIGEMNGGAEFFAIRMAQSLDPTLFEVAICNLWSYDSPIERRWQREMAAQGIPVYYGAPFRSQMRRDTAMAFIGCYRHVRALRPDIINSHTEFADLVGLALVFAGNRGSLVRTAHNTVEWTFAPHIGRITHALYPFVCAEEVAVAPAIVAALDQRLAARLSRTHTRYIHNGVDAEAVLSRRSNQNIRATLGIPSHAPLFGTAARLSEQKGIPYLIEAMRYVREALPEAQLLVAGKGEQQNELQALISRLQLDDCVSLLGARTDAIDIIGGLDVFVLASLWEGLPTVLLEAILLGTPVVATDIPGNHDLVIDKRTGRLAPARDAKALAAAIIQQYCDRQQAQEMARAARDHAAQFSMQLTIEHYARLYTEIYCRRASNRR